MTRTFEVKVPFAGEFSFIRASGRPALFVSKDDGRIYTQGVDFGPRCFIVWENETHLIFRSEAHKRWSGIGMTRNVPTSYYLCEKGESGKRVHDARALVTVDVGQYYRKAIPTLRAWLEHQGE